VGARFHHLRQFPRGRDGQHRDESQAGPVAGLRIVARRGAREGRAAQHYSSSFFRLRRSRPSSRAANRESRFPPPGPSAHTSFRAEPPPRFFTGCAHTDAPPPKAQPASRRLPSGGARLAPRHLPDGRSCKVPPTARRRVRPRLDASAFRTGEQPCGHRSRWPSTAAEGIQRVLRT